MLFLFLKASKCIFLYFLFNNKCRSDLHNCPSVLSIFWVVLMGGWTCHIHCSILPFIQHDNNWLAHPSTATPSTFPQIRGHVWVIVYQAASSQHLWRDHWYFKGKGLGMFARCELLLMGLSYRTMMVSLSYMSTTTNCLMLHTKGPFSPAMSAPRMT